jgi:AraC-like DNA-binding protein/mannose-6-phosphate isomerase-like protein (cupin superfamily)
MTNALIAPSCQRADGLDSLVRLDGERFCTEQQPSAQRVEWLKEVIGREYANVDIKPSQDMVLFNDMWIYPWQAGVRLSPIQSNAITLERLPQEPSHSSQDCYFMVVLTSGKYKLEQGGREVFLKPGDMTIYDATQPHRITTPDAFSKILISIPRMMLDQRLNNIGRITATQIPSAEGIGSLTSSFIQSTVKQLEQFSKLQFQSLSQPMVDMVTLSLGQVIESKLATTSHRQIMLIRIKQYIKSVMNDPELNATKIAEATGLSKRYINNLFNEENTSLMHYLIEQRLELCRYYLSSVFYTHLSVTQIAMQYGFNNMSHFSRIFKKYYGYSPRAYRQLFTNF